MSDADDKRKRLALDHAQRVSRARDAAAWSAASEERERIALEERARRERLEAADAELVAVEAARHEVAAAIDDVEAAKVRDLEHGEPYILVSHRPDALEAAREDAERERAKVKR